MYCQNCKNELPDGAAFCPKCGTKVETNGEDETHAPNQLPKPNPKKPITKKWWFWGIIVVVVIIAISSIGGGGQSNPTQTDSDATVVESTSSISSGEEQSNPAQIDSDPEVVESTENETNENKDISNKNETEQTGEMSAADIYVWMSENDPSFEYSIPEKAVSFMESNPQFFPGSDENTGAMSDYVDYEADYPHVAKSPAKYADKFMSIYGDIVDCSEIETAYGTVTYLQINDYSGYAYCMYYLGTLEDAFEGYSACVNVLPFGTVTFENMGGAYTEAVIGAACYVDVETYDDYEY